MTEKTLSDGNKEYLVEGAVTIGMEQMVPIDVWRFGKTDDNSDFQDQVDKIALLALRDRAMEKGFGVIAETLRRRIIWLKVKDTIAQFTSALVTDPEMYEGCDEEDATVAHLRWEIVGLPQKKDEDEDLAP